MSDPRTLTLPAPTLAKTIGRFLAVVVLVGGAIIGFRAEAQTNAAIAVTSTSLNQRSGPGTQYPPLQVIPRGGTVTLYGCIAGYSWCEGVHRGTRGWVSSSYVQVWSQGRYITVAQFARETRLPVFAFNLESYWDRYYQNYAFYADRDRWISGGGSVGVQIGSFYRPLSQYGRWVELNGQYVWVPATNANWRPYTEGRWVFTRRHGWTWVSNEPFGWATYHYGRWGYSHRMGWFWVPGTRWAPAWVSWRQSGDFVAWAPLPPRQDDPFGFGGPQGGPLPDYYWQPVPANLFLSINLTVNIIRDEDEKEQIVAATEESGTVGEVDNTIVNTALDPAFVSEVTQEEVTPVEVVLTNDPNAEQTSGETIELYQPPIEEATSAPPEVTSVEVAASESATAGQAPADAQDTEGDVPPPPPADSTPPPTDAPPLAATETPPTDAAAAETVSEPVDPAELVCPEGTTLQEGECVLPAADTPPPPPDQPPVIEGAPADTPPPADEVPVVTEPPAATDVPPLPPADQPAPPPPGDEPPPPPPADEPPPPPPPSDEPPPPADEPPPPPPPAEEQTAPPAEQQTVPAEEQPPPAPPECPEGTVLQESDNTCVVPPPAE